MAFVLVEGIAGGKLWPREVPFRIKAADFPLGSDGRHELELAITQWNDQVPHIPLVDRAQQKDFVEFVRVVGRCRTSDFGRRGGRQEVRCDLGGSAIVGNVLHEVGHAVGFKHEMQRPDSTKFIKLIEENVDDGSFDVISDGSFEPVGVYDYDSIMHYPVGNPPRFEVLRLDEQPGAEVGQRDQLSARDIQGTLYMYGFRVTRSVDFGLTAIGDIRVRQVSIKNHLSRSIRIQAGAVSPAFFTVGAFPTSAERFRTVTGTVQFRPTASGPVKATLSLRVEGIPVKVRLGGRGSDDIQPQ
jgi:hypothetical protein